MILSDLPPREQERFLDGITPAIAGLVMQTSTQRGWFRGPER